MVEIDTAPCHWYSRATRHKVCIAEKAFGITAEFSALSFIFLFFLAIWVDMVTGRDPEAPNFVYTNQIHWLRDSQESVFTVYDTLYNNLIMIIQSSHGDQTHENVIFTATGEVRLNHTLLMQMPAILLRGSKYLAEDDI